MPQKSFDSFSIALTDFFFKAIELSHFMVAIYSGLLLFDGIHFLDFFLPHMNNTEINTLMHRSSHITAFLFMG